ncbi:hypothetical protein DFQ28_010712 [Apophysomyces sp. BC1034]|nr:hypothetical protein DFQ30_010588 [Apophysomyces sp. BC1015]KAG0170165.1 hypothetical protein DFQ29_009415 [Apophysomyces sp. BC1021]KAG0184690.1 hypothetical protein DFQ28_010712 [Apophysomyces sp. BC1034]
MEKTAPAVSDSRRLCRKLTINMDQDPINVRPVIKGAMKEAAHTMTDAYDSNAILGWCVQKKHNEFLYTLFKNMINSASIQSRDFAVQVEGCKGVLVWTTSPNGLVWPRVLGATKLMSYGWTTALRALIKYQPVCDKVRRRLTASYEDGQCLKIAYIGVLPHEQRKGLGSALLQHVLDKADTAHYPVLVEVTDAKAVQFFQRFGFNIEETVHINNDQDLPVVFMVREPQTSLNAPQPLRIRPGRRDSDDSL